MKHALAPFTIMFLTLFSSIPVSAKGAPPSLVQAVQRYLKAEEALPSFRHALLDLNGDAILDALVLFESQEMCGSAGCSMVVFRGEDDGFSVVSHSTVTNAPIRILPDRVHGWATFIVATGGVGDVLMRFNGSGYPLNPSLQPKATHPQLAAAHVVIERRAPR
jgi:hypothetical protein